MAPDSGESTFFRSSGPKEKKTIPLWVPEIRGNEWKYLKECLETTYVSSVGPFVKRLEQMVAEFVGARFAVATMNGTSALHIALLVAGIEPDQEVLVPSLTFVASANVVRYVGAWPVFMDSEPSFLQMDPQKVSDFLSNQCHSRDGTLCNNDTGRRIKAILPVHLNGHPVDMDSIQEMARRFDLVVIEDSAQSLGARYKGRMAGNLADIATLSFNGNKIITSGGGGMIVTDNEEWATRAKYLTTQARDTPDQYCHSSVGYNYRLTNIQAAVGVAQMEQLEEFVGIKRNLAATYQTGLVDLEGISLPGEAPWALSTYWYYAVTVDEENCGRDCRMFRREMANRDIKTGPMWLPINEMPPYRTCQSYMVEVAPRISHCSFTLPSSVGLKRDDQQRVIEAMRLLSMNGC